VAADVVVFGAGGFGREVAWLAEACGRTVRCFVEDGASAERPVMVNDLPVLPLDLARARFPEAELTVAVGAPAGREALAARALATGARLATLIHPRVERSRWLTIGSGVVICAGCILTTNITLGDGVQMNLDCTVGHDAVLEDYVTLAPGVHVSGRVRIARGAYVGTGATIINGRADAPLTIGAGAPIGAGACVTRDIPAGVTAVGVPARPRA
jgi:sugar O-acyltransferase (sialic acid O-acetyltransferase NeuD family)